MGYRQTLALLLAAAIAAAADRECDTVLNRATDKVRAQFRSLTAYTCLETVEREYYQPRGNTLDRDCRLLMEQRPHPTPDMALMLGARDRLRMEVAISARGEIQSWPGASKFTDAGIDSLVVSGPIGTGAFGIFLNMIFTVDVKTFHFTGETMEANRRCLIYNFDVPVSDSHYRVKSQDGRNWMTVDYDGVIYLDARTADPIRLIVVTKNVPPAAKVCQTATTLNLVRDAGIAEGLLIPQSAGQRFISPNGSETQNRYTFSSCRQYSSESTISFFTPPSDPAPASRRTVKLPPDIPTWLPFSMELVTPIDSDTAAIGDRFSAKLSSTLADGRRVIAPKGARIEGRISKVESNLWPKQSVTIGLTPESIQIQGSSVPFGARLDLRPAIVVKARKHTKGLEFYLPEKGQVPHEFRLPGTHNVLAKGFTSEWLTAAPRPR